MSYHSPMPYCFKADLIETLPAFKGTSVEAQISEALDLSIEEADSIIDAKLSLRYEVPFTQKVAAAPPVEATNPPKIVETISKILSKSIFLSGTYLANAANAEPKTAEIFWNRAMYLLDCLVSGSMAIHDIPDGAVAQNSPGIVSNTKGKKPNVRSFDMFSPLSPDLNTQMRNSQTRDSVHGDS